MRVYRRLTHWLVIVVIVVVVVVVVVVVAVVVVVVVEVSVYLFIACPVLGCTEADPLVSNYSNSSSSCCCCCCCRSSSRSIRIFVYSMPLFLGMLYEEYRRLTR